MVSSCPRLEDDHVYIGPAPGRGSHSSRKGGAVGTREDAVSADEYWAQRTAAASDSAAPSVVRPRRTFLVRASAALVGTVLAAGAREEARPAGLLGPGGRLRMALAAANKSAGVSRSALGRGVVTRGAPVEVKQGTDVVIDAVAIAAGGTTGWHTHPGPEVLLVTKGALVFRRSDGLTCKEETVTAGQAFVGAAAGELHEAHNDGPEAAELVVTFFNVPSGQPPRADADPPLACP